MGVGDFVTALRKSGLGLLDGEVEHLSTDTAFLSPTNKLSLDKIYQIRVRLTSGGKLSSFMELAQIRQFLAAVFAKSSTPDDNCTLIREAAAKIVESGDGNLR